jgi:alanyl-tRNA synthetase
MRSIKDGLSLTIAKAASADQANMRKLSDIYVDKFPKGVLCLYAIDGDKVSFLIKTNKLNKSIDCSNIVKASLPLINGRGGGKPDMAQASGDASKVSELLKQIESSLQ